MDNVEQPIHITGDPTTVKPLEHQQSDSGKSYATTTTSNRIRNNNNIRRDVPRHMRMRYWSSFEELKLVELWRFYASEIISLQQNHPIFRQIADSMKQYGFQVNPQECRRKIHALKNKYLNEKEKIVRSAHLNGIKISSEWRLFPLIECILEPKKPCSDLQHELRIVNKVLAQLTPSECVALLQSTTNTSVTNLSSSPTPTATTTNPYKRIYNPRPASRSAPSQSQLNIKQAETNSVNNKSGLNFKLTLTNNFKLPTLDELRKSNQYLEVNRDYAFTRLRIEEAEFKLLQTHLSQWQLQQEQVLNRL